MVVSTSVLSHYTVPYDQVRFVIQIVMERCKTSGFMAMFLGIDLGIDIDKQKSIGSS